MAKLSNINGKFAVEDTGAIRFSDQTGTTGQILKSNGNAAPTWIPQSDIVGAYLPLAGGILTGATSTASGISFTVGGALTGTTATFTGDLTVNSTLKWATTNSTSYTYSNADSQGLYIETAGSTAALSDMRFQARSAGSGNYSYIKIKPSDQSILLGTNAADRLTINSSGNAIFAGTVTSSAFLMSNGSFTQNGFWGTTINAGSGSLADFALLNSATAGIMYNPTGTLNMVFQGNVGVGGSPVLKLEVQGTASSPTPFGSAAVNGVVRIASGGTNPMLDIGSNSAAPYEMWLQAHVPANTYGTPISLQPLGGNVGIGTASPNEKLQLAGNLNAYAPGGIDAGLFASTAAGSTTIALRSSGVTHFNGGNVGIGTTSPLKLLTVKKATSTTTIATSEVMRLAGTAQAVGNKNELGFANYDNNYNASVVIGTEIMSTLAYLKQDLYFATRDSTSDIAPTERMRITSGGQIQTPSNPAFRARSKTGQTYGAGWQHVLYDESVTTRGTGYANSRFTAPVDGWYQFNAQWTAVNNADVDGTLSMWIDGSSTNLVASVSMPNTGGNYDGHTISGCCYLAASSYVQVHRYSTVSNTTRTNAAYGGWFSGFLIG